MMMNTRDPEEGIEIITEFMEKINQCYLESESGDGGEDSIGKTVKDRTIKHL